MKLLVISDVHGMDTLLRQIVAKESDADAIIFTGDGLASVMQLQEAHPALRIYCARGNCDSDTFAPTEATTAFDGVMTLYTHGHLYQVKSSVSPLLCHANRQQAQLVLFGHTHMPLLEQINGITLFNPGAVSSARGMYGVVTITDGMPQCAHHTLF